MSEETLINIIIHGKGGHGSEPENAIDPVRAGIEFHNRLDKIKEEKYKGKNFVNTFPIF